MIKRNEIKKTFILFLLFFAFNANATHWLTYYVYHETEYDQGPWIGVAIIENTNYKYLVPVAYSEMFGSENIEIAKKIVFRLKEKKPEIYNFEYEIAEKENEITLTIKEEIKENQIVKNEIITSLINNGFTKVIFRFLNKEEVCTIKNVTLPYFKLQYNKNKASNSIKTLFSINKNKKTLKTNKNNLRKEDTNRFWFVLSLLFNILLILLIFVKKRKQI